MKKAKNYGKVRFWKNTFIKTGDGIHVSCLGFNGKNEGETEGGINMTKRQECGSEYFYRMRKELVCAKCRAVLVASMVDVKPEYVG